MQRHMKSVQCHHIIATGLLLILHHHCHLLAWAKHPADQWRYKDEHRDEPVNVLADQLFDAGRLFARRQAIVGPPISSASASMLAPISEPAAADSGTANVNSSAITTSNRSHQQINTSDILKQTQQANNNTHYDSLFSSRDFSKRQAAPTAHANTTTTTSAGSARQAAPASELTPTVSLRHLQRQQASNGNQKQQPTSLLYTTQAPQLDSKPDNNNSDNNNSNNNNSNNKLSQPPTTDHNSNSNATVSRGRAGKMLQLDRDNNGSSDSDADSPSSSDPDDYGSSGAASGSSNEPNSAEYSADGSSDNEDAAGSQDSPSSGSDNNNNSQGNDAPANNNPELDAAAEVPLSRETRQRPTAVTSADSTFPPPIIMAANREAQLRPPQTGSGQISVLMRQQPQQTHRPSNALASGQPAGRLTETRPIETGSDGPASQQPAQAGANSVANRIGGQSAGAIMSAGRHQPAMLPTVPSVATAPTTLARQQQIGVVPTTMTPSYRTASSSSSNNVQVTTVSNSDTINSDSNSFSDNDAITIMDPNSRSASSSGNIPTGSGSGQSGQQYGGNNDNSNSNNNNNNRDYMNSLMNMNVNMGRSANAIALADPMATSQSNDLASMPSGQRGDFLSTANSDQQQVQLASNSPTTTTAFDASSTVCYTTVSLFLVILVTVLVTILVCFCTHLAMKHMNRHQFDLVKNTKHYNMRLNDRLHHDLSQSSSNCPIVGQTTGVNIINGCHQKSTSTRSRANNNNALLSGGTTTTNTSDHLHEYAFDNPYFKDDQLINDTQSPSNLSLAGSPTPLSPLPLHNSNNHNHHQHHHILHHQLNHRDSTSGQADMQLVGGAHTHDHHHHHFNEHISNLHQVQLSSSVNELTINGAKLDGRHLNAVDLTADGSGNGRQMRNTREGDLIAVDITGHDFIGLGFDITGNERDGIFVRSVLSRGPANESGCIEAGDKIKGLTISFDDIFLRDAIDILNCGAPYKLRLLLEKQAALLLPNSMGSRHNMTNAGNSANSLAKNCIKKLTSFCSPNGSSAYNHGQANPMTLEQQMNRGKKYVINVDSLSSINNVAIDVSSHDQLSNILGSISARRARDLNQNKSTFIDYNINSNTTNTNLTSNHKQADNNFNTQHNSSSTDHIYRSDDSATMDTRDQIVENFDDEDDNSLQFTRNDSHHLHGPSHRRATVAQTTNIQAIGTSIDLGINGNNHLHLTDHSQSRHPMDNNQQVEQTRSQPTIAVTRRDSDLGISPSQQSQQDKRFSPSKYFASTVAVSTPAMNFTPHSQSTNVMNTGNNNNNNNTSGDLMMGKQRQRPKETSATGNNRIHSNSSNSQFSSIEEMSFDETKEGTTNKNGKNMTNDSINKTDANDFESGLDKNSQQQNDKAKLSDSASSSSSNNQQQVRGHRRLKSTGGNLDIVLDNVKKKADSIKMKPVTINELSGHGDRVTDEGAADKQEQLAKNNQGSSSRKSSISGTSNGSHNYANDRANKSGQADNNQTKTESRIESSLESSDLSANVRPTTNSSSFSQPTTLVVASPNQQITDTQLVKVNDRTETGDAIKDNSGRKDSTSENKTN